MKILMYNESDSLTSMHISWLAEMSMIKFTFQISNFSNNVPLFSACVSQLTEVKFSVW